MVGIDGDRYDSAASAGHHVRVPLPITDDLRVSLDGESPPGEPYHYVVKRRNETRYELSDYGPRWERTDTNQLYVFANRPVDVEAYDRWTVGNYADGGTFSDHLTLHRRSPDGTEFRYNPQDGLRVWNGSGWSALTVGGDVNGDLAERFGMPEGLLRRAHAIVTG